MQFTMKSAMALDPAVHAETGSDSWSQALQVAARRNFRVFDVDLSAGSSNKCEFLGRVKTGLSLPDYFGGNWDALEESLRELEVGEKKGILLVFRSADNLLGLPRQDLRVLLSILRETAHFWEAGGVRFSSILAGSPNLMEAMASAAERDGETEPDGH